MMTTTQPLKRNPTRKELLAYVPGALQPTLPVVTAPDLNEVSDGKWAMPPAPNSAGNKFARRCGANGEEPGALRSQNFLNLSDVTATDERAALASAQKELDRLIALHAEFSPTAIKDAYNATRTELLAKRNLVAADVHELHLSLEERQHQANEQRKPIAKAIEDAQAPVRPLICTILGRGAGLLAVEIDSYEAELTKRAERYQLRPTATDSLLALRALRDNLRSQSNGLSFGGHWTPAGILRQSFGGVDEALPK